MRVHRILALAAVVIGSVGIAMGQTPPTSHAIEVNNATLHVGYQGASLAYGTFTLSNYNSSDVLLRGVSSPACQSVISNRNSQVALQSIHAVEDIFQRMAVPHDGTLVFPMGGYHLICQGFKADFQPGGDVPFTFHFQDVGDVTASFAMLPSIPEQHEQP